MLKKSDNMIADAIFRTIGREYYGVLGTWSSGYDAIRQILKQKANINLANTNTIMVDGSALSRHNLITPTAMMSILQYIAKHDSQLNFIAMLPLAGYDSTLRYRVGLDNAGVNGKLSAKTGVLQGAYNLVGALLPRKVVSVSLSYSLFQPIACHQHNIIVAVFPLSVLKAISIKIFIVIIKRNKRVSTRYPLKNNSH